MRCHFEESLRETVYFMEEYIIETQEAIEKLPFFQFRKKWALKGAYLSALVLLNIISQKYNKATIRYKQAGHEEQDAEETGGGLN